MKMGKLAKLLLGALLLAAFACSCVGGPGRSRPPKSRPGAAWVEGHYSPSGRWIPGHWK